MRDEAPEKAFFSGGRSVSGFGAVAQYGRISRRTASAARKRRARGLVIPILLCLQ